MNILKLCIDIYFVWLGSSDKAEEFTQETFCKAIEKIDTFEGNSKISSWLCQIAKNLWFNELKKQKKNQELKEDVEFVDDSFNLEEKIISDEDRLSLYKKIHNLDNITKEVIILRINGELSFKEIGLIFSKTENWARVTYYRGKEKIKNKGGNEYEGM